MVEEPAIVPFMLPYGLENAVVTYASSISTSLSAYADLPSHLLRCTLDLIATPPASSYPEVISSHEDAWAGADFSRTSHKIPKICGHMKVHVLSLVSPI
jgi:hypothetical protein